MKLCQEYYIAKSIPDALDALTSSPGGSKIIAGGTDLLLDIQQGRQPPIHTLVDVTGIPEMQVIEVRENQLFIGASVLLSTLQASPLVSRHSYALWVASGLIGGPQVRNTATLGGNIAHALPAADCTIALVAANARAEIASISERQIIPLTKLFLGPGKSTLEKVKGILVGFYIDLIKPGQASAFRRIMRPQGVAIAILNTAIWLHREGDLIRDIRIAVGPSGPVPRRLFATENELRHKNLSDDNLSQAYQVLLQETHFRTSPHRASQEYRQKVAGVLLRETLVEAFERSCEPSFS